MSKRQVYLTDEQLRVIAEAPPGAMIRAVAEAVGAPYFTVAQALRRVRQHGWACRLAWGSCVVCGQPLARGDHHRPVAHAVCRPARRAERQRRYRRERRPGALSTPYVADWKRRHPERARGLYEREKARLRALWPDRPPAEREAILARAHEADQRDQPLTAQLASSSGAAWSEEDDRYVWEHLETPARDVALALGRTLYAVRTRRVALRRRAAADSSASWTTTNVSTKSRSPRPRRRRGWRSAHRTDVTSTSRTTPSAV